MDKISTDINLRPTRIGFLVRPNDKPSIRKIMRINCCLWGGVYNPIIPVFMAPPKEWKGEHYSSVKGYNIAKGYINFFEPDVFVEAEAGLAEKVGLDAYKQQEDFHPWLLKLDSLLEPQNNNDWSEPSFGLSILDVLQDIYESEEKFQLKEPRKANIISPKRGSLLSEVLFGVYPEGEENKYFKLWYKDVFSPNEKKLDIFTWREHFLKGFQSPLRVTAHKLDAERFWHHDPVVFVFDGKSTPDLIELWNKRLLPNQVIPIPVHFFKDLSEDISKIILKNNRPIRGNPHGLKHKTTIEFSPSIIESNRNELLATLNNELPNGAYIVQTFRNNIWDPPRGKGYPSQHRMKIASTEERNVDLKVDKSSPLSASYEGIDPDFASKYGGTNWRWVNVLKVSSYQTNKLALIYPYNLFTHKVPVLNFISEGSLISSEGWVFGATYKGSRKSFKIYSGQEAIINQLSIFGIKARLSEPGQIASQMLEQLGGFYGIYLLRDAETLQLLNKMAGGLRRRNNIDYNDEENFERRTASLDQWSKIISKRKSKFYQFGINSFTEKNIINVGLETECSECKAKNWHSLSEVDYNIGCKRCLNTYSFPQGNLKSKNHNWKYRVVGPFSVPDYGRGSYGAILTLDFLQSFKFHHSLTTYSTALDLKIKDKNIEVDFAALVGSGGLKSNSDPSFIFGEAKSFGAGDIIKPKDIESLRTIGREVPNSFIVVSVLRDQFTEKEIKLLTSFAKWGRRSNEHWQWTNPIVLLTANELLENKQLELAWKKKGGKFKAYIEKNRIDNILDLAVATQSVYLSLPTYNEWADEKLKKHGIGE